MLIDTHSHLYLPAFDEDRDAMVQRAFDAGVQTILLPNIDSGSIDPMLALCAAYPGRIRPMMGLHPCDVKEDFRDVLTRMRQRFDEGVYCAVGETGIDLYWDKSTLAWQQEAFRIQVEWAKDLRLPIVIHARESFDELFAILDEVNDDRLKGVFHCFTGTRAQADHIDSYGGFMMGLGGVVTYARSGLADVVPHIPREKIVLETDSPFLPPVPHRGKRNESAYVALVAQKLAELLAEDVDEIARFTSENARRLFHL